MNPSETTRASGSTDLADHLDLMFGVGRRKMKTSESVEVWREPPAENSETPYFRKWFMIPPQGKEGVRAMDWNSRETQLLQSLDDHLESRHIQEFYSAGRSHDRSRKELMTLHAGPSVENWLDLPVRQGERRLVHIFHDCAHWFSLARNGLEALREINEAGCLHLDIKPDNLCVPTLTKLDLRTNLGFHLDLPHLRLIDFAFSLWQSERQLRIPLGSGKYKEIPLGLGIYEEVDYQSRMLRHAIAKGEEGDLGPTHQLDWRADLYGFGWMLDFILKDLPALGSEGAPGWTEARRRAADELVSELKAFDQAWMNNPEGALPSLPHASIVARIDALLANGHLRGSLTAPWFVIRDAAWQARDLATPATKPALGLRTMPSSQAPSPTTSPAPSPDKETGAPGSPLGLKWLGIAALLLAVVGGYTALSTDPVPENVAPIVPAPAPLPVPVEPPVVTPQPLNNAAPTSTAPSATTTPKTPPPAAPVAPPPSKPTAAQLGEQLAANLRDAAPARLDGIVAALPAAEGASAADVQKIAADRLLEAWNAAPLGDKRRTANLDALLWLMTKLPAPARREIETILGNRYWTLAAAQGNRSWWKQKSAPDAQGRAWLAEARQLADSGFRFAHHTLAHAQALGNGMPKDSARAGRRLSLVLDGITRQTLADARNWRKRHASDAARDTNPLAADAIIVELAVNLASQIGLVGNDREFAASAALGLKHLASLGEPAAAAVLGDIYACRFTPARTADARAIYALAQQDPAWAKAIRERIATVIDGGICDFSSRPADTR